MTASSDLRHTDHGVSKGQHTRHDICYRGCCDQGCHLSIHSLPKYAWYSAEHLSTATCQRQSDGNRLTSPSPAINPRHYWLYKGTKAVSAGARIVNDTNLSLSQKTSHHRANPQDAPPPYEADPCQGPTPDHGRMVLVYRPGISRPITSQESEPWFPPRGGLWYTPFTVPMGHGDPVLSQRDHNPPGVPVAGKWCCQCRAVHRNWVGISNRNDCPTNHSCANCGNNVPLSEWPGPVG
ncbi:hypothetical protein M011DRAFT_35974 [Sporormia fimetaria CBS 119925]|uniref:Uncharacterized protein n=1 Tax=Sporormia fimetaria CBS 119925 TaxID=1340428 RepID=A0A6A6VF97_9PLEO|nr:hypothetical protein M011DRAFT_35974 [Sporormia fimetaria CBS 119925]